MTLLFSIACSAPGRITQMRNDALPVIRKDYPGNAMRDRMYVNYEDVALPGLGKVLKWRFSENPQREEKKKDTWLPEVRNNPGMFLDRKDKIVWLGHASFLVTLHGKNILIDPVFGDIPFVDRKVPAPFAANEAAGIDYVLVSHGHFDHCDKNTFRALIAGNPQMQVFSGLNMKKVISGFDKRIPVQEAGWYQKFQVDDEAIEIFFMPAFHWFKRGLSDNNRSLWGSFVIRCGGRTIFFMGDSGYNAHFKEIASYFPKIDYCIMGIGAYQPSYMMKTSHMTPEEAVQAFHDLGGRTFIPMHYGTFDLADEPFGEPLRKIRELGSSNRINGELKTPVIGEELIVKP